jgi:hypothetical protein
MSENVSLPVAATAPLSEQTRQEAGRLSARSKWILLALTLVTVMGIGLVWWQPQESLWHFWLIAQALPLVYCLLTYWGGHAD